MARNDPPKIAEISWEGDSKEVLSAFPAEVKIALGFSLRQIQAGRLPVCGRRSLSSLGQGVWELKEGDERTWYHLVYLTVIDNVIYVLHCFEKDSRKTDLQDKELIASRLKMVKQRLRDSRQ
jgi:phage-related protein